MTATDNTTRIRKAPGDPTRKPRPGARPEGLGEVTSCTVPGCPDAYYGRGYCQKHYRRWLRRGGNPGSNLRAGRPPILEAQISKHVYLDPETDAIVSARAGSDPQGFSAALREIIRESAKPSRRR